MTAHDVRCQGIEMLGYTHDRERIDVGVRGDRGRAPAAAGGDWRSRSDRRRASDGMGPVGAAD
jgi:hypothetical protein